jgi:hypothetical protein
MHTRAWSPRPTHITQTQHQARTARTSSTAHVHGHDQETNY